MENYKFQPNHTCCKNILSEYLGGRLKIRERVENIPGTPDEGRLGGIFSLRASAHFDARRVYERKIILQLLLNLAVQILQNLFRPGTQFLRRLDSQLHDQITSGTGAEMRHTFTWYYQIIPDVPISWNF